MLLLQVEHRNNLKCSTNKKQQLGNYNPIVAKALPVKALPHNAK